MGLPVKMPVFGHHYHLQYVINRCSPVRFGLHLYIKHPELLPPLTYSTWCRFLTFAKSLKLCFENKAKTAALITGIIHFLQLFSLFVETQNLFFCFFAGFLRWRHDADAQSSCQDRFTRLRSLFQLFKLLCFPGKVNSSLLSKKTDCGNLDLQGAVQLLTRNSGADLHPSKVVDGSLILHSTCASWCGET